jgi:hypothetical protein
VKIAALVSALFIGLSGGVGCGTIGPPIPPEEVGLAAKLIEQKEKARKAEGKQPRPSGEEKEEGEVVLPPVRPTGNAPGD